jgi:hypothetical protein
MSRACCLPWVVSVINRQVPVDRWEWRVILHLADGVFEPQVAPDDPIDDGVAAWINPPEAQPQLRITGCPTRVGQFRSDLQCLP